MTQDTLVKLTPVPTQEHEAAAEKLADNIVMGMILARVIRSDQCETWTERLVPLIAAALADAVRVARADEREECAKVAEGAWGSPRRFGITQAKATARLIRTRAGEGDATPGPGPARTFQRRRALGVEWFEEVPATPPKKGRGR